MSRFRQLYAACKPYQNSTLPRSLVPIRPFSVGSRSSSAANPRPETETEIETEAHVADEEGSYAGNALSDLTEQENSAILAYSLIAKKRSRKSIRSSRKEKAPLIPQDHITTVSRTLLSETDPHTLYSSSSPLSPLSQAIESLRPTSPPSRNSHVILPREAALQLRRDLATGFTVAQLRAYLKELNSMQLSVPVPIGGKKDDLVEKVVRTVWSIRTWEELKREEARKKIIMIVREEIPSTRRDLFFIIGRDGTTLRRIESETSARIGISVERETYSIEGSAEDVKKAKKKLGELLTVFVNHAFDISPYRAGLAPEVLENRLGLVHEIAKMSGTYIIPAETETEENIVEQLSITGQTAESVDEANRLLRLALAEPDTTTMPSSHMHHTFVRSEVERPVDTSSHSSEQADEPTMTAAVTPTSYAFSPVHDASMMPFLVRHGGWSRVGHVLVMAGRDAIQQRFTTNDRLLSLGSENATASIAFKDYTSLKSLFETSLAVEPESSSSLLLEARFGNLLFGSPPVARPHIGQTLDDDSALSILRAPMEGCFDRDGFQKWWEGDGKRVTRWFFDGQPPKGFTHALLPHSTETTQARTVQLEYIRSSFLHIPLTSASALMLHPFARVSFEFDVAEEGKLSVREIVGERRRCVVDVFGMERNMDMRIVGKLVDTLGRGGVGEVTAVDESVRELVEKCQLLSYTDLDCPSQYDLHTSASLSDDPLILCGVTFRTTKKYEFGSGSTMSVLSVNQIEEQDGRARRCEVLLHPQGKSRSEYATVGMGYWDGFISSAVEVLNWWRRE